MFLPYETTLNLWLRAVPTYELEPEAPVESPANGGEAGGVEDASPAVQGTALPAMRLVFKGMRWITVPVWNVRESVAWQQVAEDRRGEDEERANETQRQLRTSVDHSTLSETSAPERHALVPPAGTEKVSASHE